MKAMTRIVHELTHFCIALFETVTFFGTEDTIMKNYGQIQMKSGNYCSCPDITNHTFKHVDDEKFFKDEKEPNSGFHVKFFPANRHHHNYQPIHQIFTLRVTMGVVG